MHLQVSISDRDGNVYELLDLTTGVDAARDEFPNDERDVWYGLAISEIGDWIESELRRLTKKHLGVTPAKEG